jgi:hypothetical protein
MAMTLEDFQDRLDLLAEVRAQNIYVRITAQQAFDAEMAKEHAELRKLAKTRKKKEPLTFYEEFPDHYFVAAAPWRKRAEGIWEQQNAWTKTIEQDLADMAKKLLPPQVDSWSTIYFAADATYSSQTDSQHYSEMEAMRHRLPFERDGVETRQFRAAGKTARGQYGPYEYGGGWVAQARTTPIGVEIGNRRSVPLVWMFAALMARSANVRACLPYLEACFTYEQIGQLELKAKRLEEPTIGKVLVNIIHGEQAALLAKEFGFDKE